MVAFRTDARWPWLPCAALLMLLKPATAFSFRTSTPQQCQDFTVTWNGGNAPYHLVLVPTGTVDGGHISNISIPSSSSGSYTFQLDQPAGLKFLATMYDANGWGTGGTTPVLTVGSSSDSSCVPSSSSLQYDFYFSTNPQNNPGQCSSMSISWDSKVQAPVGLYGLVPSGTAFEVSIPQGNPYSTSWTVDIAQGTQFLLLMADNGPHQTGGSTNLLTVGGGDSSCLSGSSPKTGNTASASSTVASSSSTAASSTSGSASSSSSATGSASASSGTASASSSTGTGSSSTSASASASGGASGGSVTGQGGSSSGGDNTTSGQTGGSSSNSLGAIIGGAVGGVVALALLALLLFCCLRRRRSTRRDSASQPVNRDYAVPTTPIAEKSRRSRGFNRLSMAGLAATGRRADTDDETGGGTTDDESVIGHPVDVRDPQYQASPFTGSQPPARSSGEGYSRSSYSTVPAHHEDEWGAGVLAAAGIEPEKQRLSQEYYYSPRTDAQPSLPVPPTLPDPSRRSASETGSPGSLGRSASTRKPPLPRTPAATTAAPQVPEQETRFVQHEDSGQVVDLPPRYDQLRARNPDP